MKWFPHIICVGVFIGLIILCNKSPWSTPTKTSNEPTYTVRVPHSYDYEHATLLSQGAHYIEIRTKEGKKVYITGPAMVIEE